MKAYTDLEQSRKLAEFLPLESADMNYATWTILEDGEFIVSPNYGNTIENLQEDYGNQIIPCWSLAALFNVIESKCSYFELVHLKTYRLSAEIDDIYGEELIDVFYEMILKLNEQKLL